MNKYRLYAVAALLLAPSIVLSGPGSINSSLPEIDSSVNPYQQQNCPVEGGFGCFNGSRPPPVAFCQQFMQMFLGRNAD